MQNKKAGGMLLVKCSILTINNGKTFLLGSEGKISVQIYENSHINLRLHF